MFLEGRRLWIARGVAAAFIVGSIVAIQLAIAPAAPGPGRLTSGAPPTEAADQNGDPTPTGKGAAKLKGPKAPELTGIVQWVNTPPLTIEALRGKVVLIDFWTYSCVNCLRTLPYLRDWNEKYSGKGLVVIGVHSPEFEFEKSEANVREAAIRERVSWPIAMDNNFATWRAYGNRYWPHKYLIDAAGAVRYDRIGEGGYAATENKIRELLTEAGQDVSDIRVGGVPDTQNSGVTITRELYAGYGWASGGYLGNSEAAARDQVTGFKDPGRHQDGKIYLDGAWRVDQQSVRAMLGEGERSAVAIKYTAASANVVVRPEGKEPFPVTVTLDGQPVPEPLWGQDIRRGEADRTVAIIDSPRLYNLVRGLETGTHELRIEAGSSDFVLYTYTFGG